MLRQRPLSPDDFDVIIVGGGAAGLYAALSIASNWRVGLLTKDTLSLSASDWAQGGIAAALSPQDSTKLHIEDTLIAGAGLCEPSAVAYLAEHAADCIQRLVELGVAFDREGGQLAMTLEAAHSRHRVLHAADTTGRAVVSVLAEAVLQRPNITVFESAFVLDLWIDATATCQGVAVFHAGQIRWLTAQATVLATGGGGQVYGHTTNPAASTGDGVAMAWRSGGLLRDLEFMQFHPTSLSIPGAPPFLISEAVRGEGAHLIDSQGTRFVTQYHAAAELAPRDVVSRAIFTHLRETQTTMVWLDMRPIPSQRLQHRFPNILQVCRQWGIDPLTMPVPVAPAAHYWMGGIVTDQHSQTSIPRLYAVGENASTGVHGANRLASNSLLECLVYGAQLEQLPLQSDYQVDDRTATSGGAISVGESHRLLSDPQLMNRLHQRRQELANLIWNAAGISRHQTELDQAITVVEAWRSEFDQEPLTLAFAELLSYRSSVDLAASDVAPVRAWGELRNLQDVAWLVLKSAVFRTESRGGHFRRDYPEPSQHWRAHTLVQGNRWWRSPILANDCI